MKIAVKIRTNTNNNHWIYFLQKPMTLIIICKVNKEYTKDVLLHQTGVL